MTDQRFTTGAGRAGAPQRLAPAGSVSFNKIPEKGEDTVGVTALPDDLSTAKLTQVEIKAALALLRVLKATGADWATETQWRAFADRDREAFRIRGFRIPELVEKGAVEVQTAVFHAARNGVDSAPLPIYRLNLQPQQ
jgi:hypothetical protein